MPVMNLSVSGRRSVDELYKLADEKIAPRLTTVSGVASAGISGGRQQEVVVDVDVDRLRAYGLSILQLNQLLQAENLSAPAGTITERGRDNSVRVNALYTTPEKIRDTVIASTAAGPVRVGDVARVSRGYQRIERIQRTNGREAVGILLTKQSGANTLQVADGVRRTLDKLRPELPSDVQIEVVSDQSIFTRSSLDSVQLNLVEAVLLTGIVLLLFLHTWRSTFIVLIAIPTSLISTFTPMYALGFTLNMMSLMALALTVGILVDDSIVVLENIFRHLEIGESRFNAALKGRSEIGMAAIAITLCDVVVYAPIAFVGEIVGQYFRQFGLVVATATLLSLFISFTLTPMLASLWLRLPDPTSRSPLARFGDYGRLLRLALRHRLWTVGLGLASLAAGVALIAAHAVGAEFMPRTDESQLIATLEMPAGTTLGVTNEAARTVEERLRGWPETKAVFSTIGVGGNDLLTSSRARSARITVELVKPNQRTRSQAQLADAARSRADDIPNAKLRVSQASFVGEGGPPLSILVSGDDDARLAEIVHRVEAIARAVPGTADVHCTPASPARPSRSTSRPVRRASTSA
jgi:HAE1 family hydrophobic/amphiphilic exporter-1